MNSCRPPVERHPRKRFPGVDGEMYAEFSETAANAPRLPSLIFLSKVSSRTAARTALARMLPCDSPCLLDTALR